MAKVKQGKGKIRKIVTIIKARGKPDEVSVERSEGQPKAQPEQIIMPQPAKLPKSVGLRITPKRPRIGR